MKNFLIILGSFTLIVLFLLIFKKNVLNLVSDNTEIFASQNNASNIIQVKPKDSTFVDSNSKTKPQEVTPIKTIKTDSIPNIISLTTKFYDVIDEFKYDVAVVRLNEKYGLINMQGVEIIPPIYENLEVLNNNFIKIINNNLIEYIDSTGKHITNKKYDNIYTHKVSGFDILGIPNSHDISDVYIPIDIKYDTDFDIILENGKVGFIDSAGNEIVSPKYEYASLFFNGYAIVYNNGKYGFINTNGKEEFPIIYDAVSHFSEDENMALVKKKNSYGLLFKSDKKTPKIKYDYIDIPQNGIYSKSFFAEKILIFNKGKKYGLLDKYGNETISPKFDNISTLGNGLAIVQNKNKYGVIDSEGNIILPLEYYSLNVSFFGENIFAVGTEKNLFGLADNTGVILPLKYDKILGITRYNNLERCFIVKKGNITYVVNSEDKILFSSSDNIIRFTTDNLFVFSKNNKFGVKNFSGEIILEPVYKDIKVYENTISTVFIAIKDDKYYNIFDINGNKITNSEFDNISIDNTLYTNSNYLKLHGSNIFQVQKSKMVGIIDSKGNTLVPTNYKDVKSFFDENNVLYFIANSDSVSHLYSQTGKLIVELDDYSISSYMGKNILKVMNKNRKQSLIQLQF